MSLPKIFTVTILFVKAFLVFAQDDLISVVVLFRHGDRTPVDPYPNDPYKNSSYWPVGFGQLTNQGKERHYQLGKWFRKRYQDFLPTKYSEKDIRIRSTDVDRTLMSAESHLAGLFPPRAGQIWDADIPWQPIPIHTVPEKEDAVLAMKKPCPKYGMLYKKLMESKSFREINHSLHDMYAYLTRLSGRLVNDLTTLEYFYNTLLIEKLSNYTIPAWAQNVFKKIEPWAFLSFATTCYTPDLARLKVGPLLDDFIQYFTDRTSKNVTIPQKYMVYSAHDTTIANVLSGLGAFEYHSPAYCSSIIFELFRNSTDQEPYLNIYYKNSTFPQKIKLKGCNFNCKLDDFIDILFPITVDVKDWENECYLPLIHRVFGFTGNIICLVILGACLLMSFAVYFVIVCKKTPQNSYMQLPNEENSHIYA